MYMDWRPEKDTDSGKIVSKYYLTKKKRKLSLLAVNKYGLLTKRVGKMAGYGPSSFFACLWSRSINTQKKERGQYPAILTEQAWSIKDLLYGIKHQKMILI